MSVHVGGLCDSGVCGSQDSGDCSITSHSAPFASSNVPDCQPCGLDGQSCCGGYYAFCTRGEGLRLRLLHGLRNLRQALLPRWFLHGGNVHEWHVPVVLVDAHGSYVLD